MGRAFSTKAKRKENFKMKIRSIRQFKQEIDAAFETMRTRDEAKACYDFSREEYKSAEEELCAYAAANPDVFEGTDGASGWGETESVEYTMTGGMTVERADGGKLSDAEFLKGLPTRYVRAKLELNKAKIKADGLDADALAKLGLVRIATMSMKLKPINEVNEPSR